MDLVLQGSADNYTLYVANTYLRLPFVKNIIISCWNNNNIQTNEPRIRIIKSKDVEHPGVSNINRQLKSSLVGLKEVTTEFTVKLRSDQRISLESMEFMYSFYEKNKERELQFYNNPSKPKNKICVAGNFKPFPFHPRDHFFWGNTQDLIDLFDIPYRLSLQDADYNKIIRTEAYIWAHYCSNFNPIVNTFIQNPELYLVDNAPKIKEAFEISNSLNNVFKIFPKVDIEWPKCNPPIYNYDLMALLCGEYWTEI